jgi:hypothetical protein
MNRFVCTWWAWNALQLTSLFGCALLCQKLGSSSAAEDEYEWATLPSAQLVKEEAREYSPLMVKFMPHSSYSENEDNHQSQSTELMKEIDTFGDTMIMKSGPLSPIRYFFQPSTMEDIGGGTGSIIVERTLRQRLNEKKMLIQVFYAWRRYVAMARHRRERS